MSAIRDEIRAVLREELSALRAEAQGVTTEVVRIDSSEDLNAFALSLVERFSHSGLAAKLKKGELQFVLEAPRSLVPSAPPMPVSTIVPPSTPMRPQKLRLDKKLITETDLLEIAPGPLQIPKSSRITPLARDEAQRRGIRIERTEA